MLKYLQTISLLGFNWVLFRALYEVKIRLGQLEKRTSVRKWGELDLRISCNFFTDFENFPEYKSTIRQADQIITGKFIYFSKHEKQLSFPPNWFSNPFFINASKDGTENSSGKHWSRIPDFSVGDLKGIWEIGRFGWVYPLIVAYKQTGEERYAESFWLLVEDWAEKNLPNLGVHWKCGQEVAIRMFALVTGYFAFTASTASTETRKNLTAEILHRSAERIDANIGYALSQKNNHGISETSGLFTAGLLLDRMDWMEKGKKLIEDQAVELIYEDGSFSQHSANYHRLMLHDYLWAVQLGRANGVELSNAALERIRAAGKWLVTLYDPLTGRMPNLGANDGAHVFPVTDCDYLDYRPTIQAAGAVLEDKPWIENGEWDALACWFAPETMKRAGKVTTATSTSDNWNFEHLKDGSYAVFYSCTSKIIFRCPRRFQHRPSHCDLLHMDVWHRGANLLRDGGTFSYNCEPQWQDYFKSVQAHNTIQFDDHDQMPQLSRFLFGKWPQLDVEIHGGGVSAGFTDWKKCNHHRAVDMKGNRIKVTDTIKGFNARAILRWRLAPELAWQLTESGCRSDLAELWIHADADVKRMKIESGWESLYYMEKTEIPVLEVTIRPGCSMIESIIDLK